MFYAQYTASLTITILAVVANFVDATNSPANAEAAYCESELVSVETDNVELHGRICKMTTVAIPMLEECHLKLVHPVTIGFPDSSVAMNHASLGLYDSVNNGISLLKPEAFHEAHSKTKFWSSVPVSEHYDSVVVHELAHAAHIQSTVSGRKSTADGEYIAYSMQLASLRASTRDLFMASVNILHPKSTREINSIVLGLAPSIFAAKAWSHFSATSNGCDFVRKIKRGETTLWVELE